VTALPVVSLAAEVETAPDNTSTESAEQVDKPSIVEGWEAAAPPREPKEAPLEPGEPPINWADTSHAYVTDQAQSLTEWMDGFFGDPNYDIEKPESLLRLEWANSWDEEDDEKSKVRLRGKLQLPAISKRLNLVFSGADGDDLGNLSEDERDAEDRVGLLYNIGEKDRTRLDLTLGISTSELRPGIRFRNQGPIGERNRYRFTQRLQYEDDEGFFTTGQLNLDRALREDTLLRWSNRAVYGEETKEVEWRSRVALARRLRGEYKKRNTVLTGFTSVKGFTDPSYIRNYRIGALLRSQIWRRYLFMEVEPSYNWRKNNEDDDRTGVWQIVVRFEIAMERDLRRLRDNGDEE
jgi:hypothetical protein